MADTLSQRECWQARLAKGRKFCRRHYEHMVALVPTDCLLCRGAANGGRLCQGCLTEVTASMEGPVARCRICCLRLTLEGVCRDCARHEINFEHIIAAFDYAFPGDLLIKAFKSGRRFVYARALAEILAKTIRQSATGLPASTILVPVPASRASIRERGFNPAAEIARYLAVQLQLPCRPTLLQRQNEGRRQTHLNRREREQGVVGLYACTSGVDGQHITVVDDVMTTGSTLNGIARQLKAAGAASVHAVVVARTPHANF